MPIVTIFSGTYCNEDAVVKELLGHFNFKHVTDSEIIARASKASGISESKIAKALVGKSSLFNQLTHDRERAIANLKMALASLFREQRDNILAQGFTGLLAPRNITHNLRVCLIADLKHRIALAKDAGMSEDQAAKTIRRNDEERAAWTAAVLDRADPWDTSLYDVSLPTDKMSPDEIVAFLEKILTKSVLQTTPASEQAMDDFLTASRVEVALAEQGHQVAVEVSNGNVTLTINKHVLMLNRLKEELQSIASPIENVKKVETKIGKGFYQADIVRQQDFAVPSKVLLVDDEREFVETLSERLLMRDVHSAFVYDGQSALDVIRDEEPDVMILDLKMPGINGIEVLRRVRQSNPRVEVIILTGHGSADDRETCMQLGAFAYLQKPVDLALLNETITKAYQKIQEGGQKEE